MTVLQVYEEDIREDGEQFISKKKQEETLALPWEIQVRLLKGNVLVRNRQVKEAIQLLAKGVPGLLPTCLRTMTQLLPLSSHQMLQQRFFHKENNFFLQKHPESIKSGLVLVCWFCVGFFFLARPQDNSE